MSPRFCVDMFGEGFDLPQLKIAAIHDQHRSPAVTLQFIGRLTRTESTLGTAKFVANIANQRSDGQMKRLYEENADWSLIIREVSSERIGRETVTLPLFPAMELSDVDRVVEAVNEVIAGART